MILTNLSQRPVGQTDQEPLLVVNSNHFDRRGPTALSSDVRHSKHFEVPGLPGCGHIPGLTYQWVRGCPSIAIWMLWTQACQGSR